MPLTIGLFVSDFAGASISAFIASFLQRLHGMRLDEVGIYVGLGSAISAISPVAVGILADRVVRTEPRRAALAAVIMLTQPGTWIVVLALLTWQFFNMALTTPGMAALITMTPLGMRGTVIACISVGNMLIWFGFGPFAVELVSDAIGSTHSLRVSLIIVATTGYLISTGAFILSGWRDSR